LLTRTKTHLNVFSMENYDIGSTDPKEQDYISLDRARAGNIGAEFFSIWAYPKTNQGHLAKRTLDLVELLRQYYRLGVRYLTLTWSNSNEWADSSGDLDDPNVKHHSGLTAFGKEVVVLEMNRLGMIVDISHVSDKTFWDTIATSKAPVIASHSSARALVDVPRNMSDDMLRAVSKNGGVVCV
jgi:membrane dipeptidase